MAARQSAVCLAGARAVPRASLVGCIAACRVIFTINSQYNTFCRGRKRRKKAYEGGSR